MVYLDNAASTRLCAAAADALTEAVHHFANPSSLHKLGTCVNENIKKSRLTIANALSCEPETLYFTSSATEANNLAIFGAVKNRRGQKIVTTSTEHPSVLKCLDFLEQNGTEVVRIPPDVNGEIFSEKIIRAVDDKTCLVSVMLVNNETGYIMPVREIFYAVKKLFPNAVTHCDAVQGFLKLPFKINDLCADAVSVSAHKIHAPKGVAALYVRKNLKLRPLIFGGGQEQGLRSGTEPSPLILSFAAAVGELSGSISERLAHAQKLRDFLVNGLGELDGITLNSRGNCSPYIVNFSVAGLPSEVLLNYLNGFDIFLSNGSACSKGHLENAVAQFSPKTAANAVRVSFSHENTEQEITELLQKIKSAQTQLI